MSCEKRDQTSNMICLTSCVHFAKSKNDFLKRRIGLFNCSRTYVWPSVSAFTINFFGLHKTLLPSYYILKMYPRYYMTQGNFFAVMLQALFGDIQAEFLL